MYTVLFFCLLSFCCTDLFTGSLAINLSLSFYFTYCLSVPGLLLSFAARLDAAKALVAIVSGDRGAAGVANYNGSGGGTSCCWGVCRFYSSCKSSNISNTYFGPLVVAYAIGLGMANIAVYVMNMGQPALLYLVPCCLGTMIFLGWRRQELRQLWDGPKVLETAEDIVFGRRGGQVGGGGGAGSRTARALANGAATATGASNNNSTTMVELSPKTSGISDDDGLEDADNENDDETGHLPLLQQQQRQQQQAADADDTMEQSGNGA
jgi:hypothetical protein